MNIWFEIFGMAWVGFMAIMWHEAGHYLAYRFFNMKPSIQWKGFSLLIGENCIGQLKGKQAVFVALSGIVAGWVLLVLVSGTLATLDYYLILLLYVAGCFFDLMVISKGLEQWNENFKGVGK